MAGGGVRLGGEGARDGGGDYWWWWSWRAWWRGFVPSPWPYQNVADVLTRSPQRVGIFGESSLRGGVHRWGGKPCLELTMGEPSEARDGWGGVHWWGKAVARVATPNMGLRYYLGLHRPGWANARGGGGDRSGWPRALAGGGAS